MNKPTPPPESAQPAMVVRTAVFISGRGSNMMALINSCKGARSAADIVLVLANRPDAAGLAWAQSQGLATASFDHRAFADRHAFESAIQSTLNAHGVSLIALAGFMRLLTAPFVEHWRGRMINIHPSLLPAHKGLDTHARAIAAGDTHGGCSVHFVEPEMDAGPVIAQARVPIEPGDTSETLAHRVLAQEHRLYPLVLQWVAAGKAKLEAGAVHIAPDLVAPDWVVLPASAKDTQPSQ